MTTLVKKSVKARDLPKEWREREQFGPDETVTIYIEPEDPELAQASNLSEIMDLIGKRAQERGLTDEKLEEILAEAKREART